MNKKRWGRVARQAIPIATLRLLAIVFAKANGLNSNMLLWLISVWKFALEKWVPQQGRITNNW
jgi:hypothetical protein